MKRPQKHNWTPTTHPSMKIYLRTPLHCSRVIMSSTLIFPRFREGRTQAVLTETVMKKTPTRIIVIPLINDHLPYPTSAVQGNKAVSVYFPDFPQFSVRLNKRS
ncbi:hypothetical protein AVEN_70514-1 [Araneus ventricosus]|uniref:Uncharacterized protein n=1 Tax=Araneus ventricosus TaxID=182803 RepID=A0A4Y2U8E1_ARAVE|nr:hypothetical protein AVEN_70514-1 [Araneus ventricosus]